MVTSVVEPEPVKKLRAVAVCLMDCDGKVAIILIILVNFNNFYTN